ncbi:MAG: hypothetical protein NC127_06175 [Muribaculum sp.]|nr:hypothetical protein [Muribaculum sp.]
MTIDKIYTLINNYYSGDISPTEYGTLLSTLKEAGSLPRQLEIERKILLSVEACNPTAPEGLEKRLSSAIDRHSRRSRCLFRAILSGSAAAVALVCLTIGALMVKHDELQQSNSLSAEPSIIAEMSQEDLNTVAQTADDALLSVISSIRACQNEMIESFESIHIDQNTDF